MVAIIATCDDSNLKRREKPDVRNLEQPLLSEREDSRNSGILGACAGDCCGWLQQKFGEARADVVLSLIHI